MLDQYLKIAGAIALTLAIVTMILTLSLGAYVVYESRHLMRQMGLTRSPTQQVESDAQWSAEELAVLAG
jgi:hypothetical protein